MILDDEDYTDKEVSPYPTHLWFFYVALSMFAISIFYYFKNSNSTIDIQLHDTYFVVTSFDVFLYIGILFSLFSIIYFYLNSIFTPPLNWNMSIAHFILTALSCLTFFYIISQMKYFPLTGIDTVLSLPKLNLFTTLLYLFFISGQLIFITNLFRGIYLYLIKK